MRRVTLFLVAAMVISALSAAPNAAAAQDLPHPSKLNSRRRITLVFPVPLGDTMRVVEAGGSVLVNGVLLDSIPGYPPALSCETGWIKSDKKRATLEVPLVCQGSGRVGTLLLPMDDSSAARAFR